MKIVEIETYPVGAGWKNWLFVRALTNEGLGFCEPGEFARSRDIIAADRTAVGPNVRILIDLHSRLAPSEAVAFIQACSDLDVPFNEPWARHLVTWAPDLDPATGELSLPDAPGLGVDLDLEVVLDHPYDPGAFLDITAADWEHCLGSRERLVEGGR